MSFADPQSLTFDGSAVSFPRTGSGDGKGNFASADGAYKLSVSNQYGTRTRRVIRVDHSKVVANDLIPDQNVKVGMSAYLVVDVPVNGYTVAQEKIIVDGLIDFLDASTGAKVTQLLGGEA